MPATDTVSSQTAYRYIGESNTVPNRIGLSPPGLLQEMPKNWKNKALIIVKKISDSRIFTTNNNHNSKFRMF